MIIENEKAQLLGKSCSSGRRIGLIPWMDMKIIEWSASTLICESSFGCRTKWMTLLLMWTAGTARRSDLGGKK